MAKWSGAYGAFTVIFTKFVDWDSFLPADERCHNDDGLLSSVSEICKTKLMLLVDLLLGLYVRRDSELRGKEIYTI